MGGMNGVLVGIMNVGSSVGVSIGVGDAVSLLVIVETGVSV